MKVAKHDLVSALQLRYDHYSAQGVFGAACAKAGLDGEQAHFDRAQVAAFRAALARVGDRLQRVDERLDWLLGEVAPTAPSTEPGRAAPPVEAKPIEAKPVETKPADVKADAKPAEKPAKSEAKPAEKPTHAKPEPKTTRIILKDFDLVKGEQLLVCGDRLELGNWDPERARPLTRDGDAWSTTVELANGDGGAFKFLRRTADGAFKWEGGENRELETVAKIEATWQP